MSIITTDHLRAYLDQVPAGATPDAKLTDIITRAQAIIDTTLGFSFFDADATWIGVAATQKRVQSERSVYLKLPPYQVGSITAVSPLDRNCCPSPSRRRRRSR